MIAACREQLAWGSERYAKLPPPPHLLELQEVPPLWGPLAWAALTWFVAMALFGFVLNIVSLVLGNRSTFDRLPWLLIHIVTITPFLVVAARPHFKATAANGDRPAENSRRLREFDDTKTAALKVAETATAAQDHRLRVQIRELEGLERTVAAKASEVSRLLVTL
jgi:hypothetical protein